MSLTLLMEQVRPMAKRRGQTFDNQTFDDGQARIYEMVNVAQQGMKPKYVLKLKNTYWYRFETVGITRFYEAKRANNQVDDVISVWQDRQIRATDIVQLDDKQYYQIEQVQHTQDDWNLRITKISLSAFNGSYPFEIEPDVAVVGTAIVGYSVVGGAR